MGVYRDLDNPFMSEVNCRNSWDSSVIIYNSLRLVYACIKMKASYNIHVITGK